MTVTDQRLPTPEQVNNLIQSRRSVFTNQFVQGRRIPDEIIWQLLENACQAPSHKLTQPWHFTVFCDGGLSKLAQFQAESYQSKAGDSFKKEKYEKLLRTPMECSHVLAIGMRRSTLVQIPEIEEVAAVACAVENIYISTLAYGIGGYWSTGGVTYSEEAKPFFGLEAKDKLMGFFYLGNVRLPSVGSPRRPASESSHWVTG
jgi:nitroreductase